MLIWLYVRVLGILFSVLIGRYGCRIVTLVGGVVWFTGFASSSLAPNIIVLYFTYGIVAGLFSLLNSFSIWILLSQMMLC